MDFQQNTEFVISKLDSIINNAMPFVEKGAEEVIKYKLIEFRAEYIIGLVLCLLCLAIGYKCIKKAIIEDGSNNNDDLPFIFSVIGAFTCFVVAFCFGIFVVFETTAFILSFTSPEIFAIMQLIK